MAASTAMRPAAINTPEGSVIYLVSWTDGAAGVAGPLPGSFAITGCCAAAE
jgi:hypothetical protein